MPFFSIILPCYNRESRILGAIESVLNQTFNDFELIIIDDASTDNSLSVIRGVNDNRIKIITNTQNQERCISRNKGITEATGEYICFLDSDDYHLDFHLEKLHQFISDKNTKGFYFSNAWNESEDGIRSVRNCPEYSNYNKYIYFLRYTVNPQRWAIHKSILSEHQFDPAVIICEDMDLSLRVAEADYPIHHLNEVTTVYVAAEDSFTHGDPKKWEKELKYLDVIFQKSSLKKCIPKREKNRLLSMCHFHLAKVASEKKQKVTMCRHVFRAFILYPKGYNGKNNLIMFVMVLYGMPIIGSMIKSLVSKSK